MSCNTNQDNSKCESPNNYSYIGWSPVLASELYNGGFVLKVIDYIGGVGNKPATGLYISVSGYTIDITKALLITPPQGGIGPQGVQGAQGATGAQGNNGSNGVQGPQGANGLNGVDGAQGSTGPQGPQGPQGTNGSNGLEGAQGPQGANGTNGADGSAGPQGNQGPQGATGPQGVQGLAADWVVMTQAQYNALPVKDPNTLYLITTT